MGGVDDVVYGGWWWVVDEFLLGFMLIWGGIFCKGVVGDDKGKVWV